MTAPDNSGAVERIYGAGIQKLFGSHELLGYP